MTRNKRLVIVIALLAATAITVFTSVEHHRHIAEEYGQIANIFVPVIATSSFILGAAISLAFQWGIDVIQFEKVARLLPEKEGAVLRVLFNRKTITQTDLASETSLSRLMISRILARIEEKGLISKRTTNSTNTIESRIYRTHPTTQAFLRLPGLSEERAIVITAVVFLFGISFSLLNSFHVIVLEHPLEPSLYLLAIEFFALGGLTNFIVRKRISEVQFEKTLNILPPDEKEVLKAIYLKKTTTQNELVEKTGIYKMKVSRIIQKFEQKGVIEKRPYGYTNRITSKI